MSEFTFVESNSSFSTYRERKAVLTDFSILLGAAIHDSQNNNEENSRIEQIGYWWTKSQYYKNLTMEEEMEEEMRALSIGYTRDDNYYYAIDEKGYPSVCHTTSIAIGARPIIPYSSISFKSSKEVRNSNNTLEVEYGEYPQTKVSEEFSKILETAYSIGILNETGKSYTTVGYLDKELRKHTEYEYNGKKYIRYVTDIPRYRYFDNKKLSDGTEVKNETSYWIEVEPIKWLIYEYKPLNCEEKIVAMSKKIIFAGVPLNRCRIEDFSKTNIKKFMDEHFSKDIEPSTLKEKKHFTAKKTNIKKRNYISDSKRDNISEEDIIKELIESEVPVFLHGPAVERKLEIIKRIDYDYEHVNLKKETLDNLIGKNQENESVPPTWYTRIVEKCQKEPQKKHILCLDEFTQEIESSIQSEVKKIILNRKVNNVWDLPENLIIVVSEKDIEESYATNPPIDSDFYNCVHVYFKGKYRTWLEWVEDNNIHPVIFAFLAYKREDILRNKDTTPKSEPKKWELASKMLYKTNNPMTLRAILGEDITKEFIEFCSLEVMKLDPYRIIDNYLFRLMPASSLRRELNLKKKYALAMKLSQVDEYLSESVRDLVLVLCGEGPCKLFDALISHRGEPRTALEEVHTYDQTGKRA